MVALDPLDLFVEVAQDLASYLLVDRSVGSNGGAGSAQPGLGPGVGAALDLALADDHARAAVGSHAGFVGVAAFDHFGSCAASLFRPGERLLAEPLAPLLPLLAVLLAPPFHLLAEFFHATL